ncbi:hypothetical protein [Streptomyces lavendulae]|uniref:hypothetical protein n=1 Tax=Streptomyces lavendulae TaxID=1914 RepID=UPI002552FF0C|nr:hypothetical protein [Streptomyces lavendulae]
MDAVTAPARIRLLRNVIALQNHVAQWMTALDDTHMNTRGLVESANTLAQDLQQAVDVLVKVETGHPLDASILPPDSAPTPEELLQALARGHVQAAETAYQRRLELLSRPDAEPTHWLVRTKPERCYEARNQEGLIVHSWAALPTTLETELATWGPTPGLVKIEYTPARPTDLPELMAPSQQELEEAPSTPHGLACDADEEAYAAHGHAQRAAELLASLRTRLRDDQVDDFVNARVHQLNRRSPQLPDLESHPNRRVFADSVSAAFTWVDPTTIVRTPDHTAWGTIDRPGERAGSVWIPAAIREWLTEDDIPYKLRTALTAGHVQLLRFPGPAGPLHVMDVNGCHRTHLWRVLDLPKIFAFVQNVPLPLQLTPFDVATDDGPTDEPEVVAAIWKGLLAKGILRGTLDRPDSPLPALELDWVPAQWLLYPPDIAAAYGRRYTEIYGPRAWEQCNIPADAFTSAAQWSSWATSAPRDEELRPRRSLQRRTQPE